MKPSRPIPFVIDGKRIDPNPSVALEVEAPTGRRYRMPHLDNEHKQRLLEPSIGGIDQLHTQAIIAFLNRAGRFWKDKEYTRRRLFERQLVDFLGYSLKMAQIEADRIGALLTSHARFHDLLHVDLGSRFMLDEWVRREECYVRAFPRGRVVQLLSGNVPMAVVVSLVRALLTKNNVVAKVASGDPITATTLALSFLDVDPDHPVSRATNVVYWAQDDEFGAEMLRSADAVCAWGGQEAVEYAHHHMSPEAPFSVFGPKTSIAMVGRDADMAIAAERVAHDVCEYNQRACFSAQHIFCEGDTSEFVRELSQALATYEDILPLGTLTVDEHADASLCTETERFLGGHVVTDESGRWRIVVAKKDVPVRNPLGRTVIVHDVSSLDECLEFIDAGIQTVSVIPWDAGIELRDALARAGVSRIVETGLNNLFRTGGSHDGVQPLLGFVRVVANEGPAHAHGKGMVVSLDQTRLIKDGRLLEIVQ